LQNNSLAYRTSWGRAWRKKITGYVLCGTTAGDMQMFLQQPHFYLYRRLVFM